MLILGIDPGLESIGYCVIKAENGDFAYIICGVIKTKSADILYERLFEIFTDIKQIMQGNLPDVIAIEELFFFKNVSSCIKVAEARGVILLALNYLKKDFKLAEYAPQVVKKQVTGNGRADKRRIRNVIHQLLGVDIKEDNACDAAAIAMTYVLKEKP